MRVDEIQVGKTYEGASGGLRRVTALAGKGKYPDGDVVTFYASTRSFQFDIGLITFADWAVREVHNA